MFFVRFSSFSWLFRIFSLVFLFFRVQMFSLVRHVFQSAAISIIFSARLVAKVPTCNCKILNLQNAIFSRQIAFSRIRCLFQNFEHAISSRGHAFSKKNSEMQNIAGISVILPRPRFVHKFASTIFSWQIAFERRDRLVAKTSNMLFFQGVSVVSPRPRLFLNFENAVFSRQIAFSKRARLRTRNFYRGILSCMCT